jgi:hypothetical protein
MECKRHKHRVGEAQGANVPPSHLEMPAHLKYTGTGANEMSLEENKSKLSSARHIALQHRHMLAAKQSTKKGFMVPGCARGTQVKGS